MKCNVCRIPFKALQAPAGLFYAVNDEETLPDQLPRPELL